MKIEEVITQAIVAIYTSRRLSELVILKGGGAMRLFDGLESRLSVDADFSVGEVLSKAEATRVFKEMRGCLSKAFRTKGYDVLDFTFVKRPKKLREGFPIWWGGWACEFKLVDRKYRRKSLEARRRNALIPEGSNSSKVAIDLSEHEFCGKQRAKTLQGVKIHAYSREMLVLEKLRAICQQHPDYPYRQETKNRARDFYDIRSLTIDMDDKFIDRCQFHVEAVFKAKEVPLWILRALWDDDPFVDEFRRGFDQVRDMVRGPVDSFDIYLEHVRFLVRDICPKIPERPAQA
ncbi:MAG TPA: nucleotidyl transferase AbiEii/AbiGii toxin family protein [Kiritimatiellia bacterium]|nr:nucleotidyl transferase AbiEii/AbiGii toxin family protein [Kiritimatiellia bacterium]